MDENDCSSLDIEFKRYLQILRPYLSQLRDQYVIDVCNAWIQRLSNCNEKEKSHRNKYIFALCYQLARGELEEPFFKYPVNNSPLPQLPDETYSDDSSSEIEYVDINGDKDNAKTLFNNEKTLMSDTENPSQDNDIKDLDKNKDKDVGNKLVDKKCNIPIQNQTILCYSCPESLKKHTYFNFPEDDYEYRTQNLIKKLREIKTENMLLHNELIALKKESKMKSDFKESDDNITRIDNATSAYFHINESNSTLMSIKLKLQEVQDSRKNLIQSIEILQEKLDNYDDMKNHEIEDIETRHKLEIIAVKSAIKEEITETYKKKFEELRYEYETKIEDVENKIISEKLNISFDKDNIIAEKDSLIRKKDAEINQLQYLTEEQKKQLENILNKCSENSKDLSTENLKFKMEELEKRLSKAEKSKTKCIKLYEAKLAQLQKEKHMTESSLQLQLAAQRAQTINEISDENQSDLITALNKLEVKYKNIVANVQATTIQRRLHDQAALDSLIKKSCGIQSENMCGNYTPGTNHTQSSGRPSQNQGRDENQSYDSEISSLMRGNRVGNVVVGNKSFGEDSIIAGYCLDGERMGQLFERVCIPQRDIGDGSLKK
ncbi:golgin subfamily A member 4-like [Galleria mellonella]|uniref:Golgin subfamily A member 4-like n=1 Tax=Galleria mellonella TaxID=7137 RepID=A0A6J1WN52_GALME|nr:golgin subfamily A member 4-like [Galleria mellonella]